MARRAGATHGFRGDWVGGDWAQIDRQAAARILDRLPALGPVESVEWHSPRPFSAGAIVRAGRERVFIKRHDRRVRTVASLRSEHTFMSHLRRRGVPVPEVMCSAGGQSAFTVDGWTCEVHRLAVGVDCYRDAQSWSPFANVGHARAAGRALAQLHRAAGGFVAPARRLTGLRAGSTLLLAADPFDALRRWIRRAPLLDRALRRRRWAADWRRVLQPWFTALAPLRRRLVPLWTHNDWHASNLLWSDRGARARVTMVIDFGLCDRTSAMVDLATAIERNAVPWLDIQRGRRAVANLPQIDALLDGYGGSRPLGVEDRAALAALLPIVHTELALSEVAYFDGITGSQANAQLAYEDYLLGHARWFAGRDGAALLAHLRVAPR